MKKIIKYASVFIKLMILFILMLVISCTFSSSLIRDNVKSSSKTLNLEGNKNICFIINKMQEQMFDNYSDSLMINTAYSIDSKTPLFSAFTAKKDYVPDVTEVIVPDRVGELSSSSKYKEHNEVAELEDTVNGVSKESFEYAKYWHGYLVFLRPLLLIFDYSQIRILLSIIFAVLAILVVNELAKNKSKTIAILYLLSLFGVEYFYIGISLINSIMFMILMISSLIIVKRYDKIKDFGVFFFIIGMCCSFFGLLDTPLLTFGGPLVLYYIYKENKGEGDFKDLVKFAISWLVGYLLTWASKWILMDVIYHRGLILTAIGQVLYRTVGGSYNSLLAICMNVLYMAIPIMIDTIIMIYFDVRYFDKKTKESKKRARIFYLISLMPIVWYAIMVNHSFYHFFFTYRLLFITMFALPVGAYYSHGEPEK